MDSLFGAIVFELIGASTKWLYISIRNSILGLRRPGFKEIYLGTKMKRSAQHLYDGMSNNMVGMVVVVILLALWMELIKTFY